MEHALTLLWRGVRLRCPVCGRGKLFRNWFHMYERCSVCHFVYEREEGYFSSAMALDLIVSELLVAAVAIPLALISGFNPSFPVLPLLLSGIALAILLPLLFYPHSRALWMSFDHLLNPPPLTDFQRDVLMQLHREMLEREREETLQ